MDIFNAIAEPTRRRMVEMLAKNSRLSATDIGKEFSMSAAAISQHLKVLREAHVVQVEKRGQQRIYQLDINSVYEIERWSHKMTGLWNNRFERLGKVLEVERKKLLKDNSATAENKKKYHAK